MEWTEVYTFLDFLSTPLISNEDVNRDSKFEKRLTTITIIHVINYGVISTMKQKKTNSRLP